MKPPFYLFFVSLSLSLERRFKVFATDAFVRSFVLSLFYDDDDIDDS